jgi:outer membrane protein assembly factor BamB
LYAFDARSGDRLWIHATEDAIVESPAVVNGVVYVASDDNYLYALDAVNGAELWEFPTGVASSPAVANGVVYIAASERPCLYALEAETGSPLWRVGTEAPMCSHAPPAVANDVVYAGSDDGHLYAFHAGTGDCLGTFVIDGPIAS